jgi:hypothetical protein
VSQVNLTRLGALGAVLAIVLAACGGAAPATPGATSAPVSSDGAPVPTGDAPPSTTAPNPGGGQLNTAVVTIGADRYEFSNVKCSIFTAGYIQALTLDGDPGVVIVLPPPGWEAQGDVFSPPEVRVTIGSGAEQEEWLATDQTRARVPDGSMQLDYNVPEGRPVTATGTGTFVDVWAADLGRELVSVDGSFVVPCP